MPKQIIPAILTDNVDELRYKLEAVSGAVFWVQVDIMDGQFVDSTTIGVKDLAGIKHESNVSIHLMVQDPLSYLDDCKAVGAKRVVYHFEATQNHNEILEKFDRLGLERGIALSPATPVASIKDLINRINVVLIMSVEPGFGGQEFIESSLKKVKEVKTLASDKTVVVDGGITEDNIVQVARAGADGLVIGSAIFFYKDEKAAIRTLQTKIK